MIILFSLLGYIFSLYLIFKKYLEFLPYFVVSVIITSIYIFGLYGEVLWAAKTLFWLGITLFPISLLLFIKNKTPIYSILTPGLVLFVIVSLLIGVKINNCIFTGWDELSHWGLITKILLITGNFPDNFAIATKLYYPPGANLFHVFAGLNSWGSFEGNAYVAQLILLLAPLAAIFYQTRWKHKLRIILILFVSHIVITGLGPGYRSLYVDHVLSIFFAMIIVIYFYLRDQPRWHLLLLAPMLFVLPLIKETGYMLAWFAILVIAIDQLASVLCTRKQAVIGISILALLAALPFLSVQSWEQKLTKMNVERKKSPVVFSLNNIRKSFSDDAPKTTKQIIAKFKSATASYLPKKLVVISLFFLFAMIGSSCWKYRRKVLVVYFWLTVFLVIYSLGLLYLYLFRFGGYEAIRLASYTRYMNLFLAAFTLVGLGIVVTRDVGDIKLKKIKLPVSVFLLIVCVVDFGFQQTCSMPANLYRFLLQSNCYKSKLEKSRAGFRKAYIEKSNLTKSTVKEGEKVSIIFQNSKGYHHYALKYELFPIVTRIPGRTFWSLGKPYYTGDVWTKDMTIEQWSDYLKEWNYVFLGKTDDRFWNDYGALFGQARNEDEVFLYKVTKKQSQQVQLLPVR